MCSSGSGSGSGLGCGLSSGSGSGFGSGPLVVYHAYSVYSYSHICVALETADANGRSVSCWGENYYGQSGVGGGSGSGFGSGWGYSGIGHGSGSGFHTLTAFHSKPQLVDLGANVRPTSIATGGAHSCVLTVERKLKCWGHNTEGELGIGTRTDRGKTGMGDALPFVNLGGAKVVAVGAGMIHTCTLFDDGKVACWGNGHDGKLGYPVGTSSKSDYSTKLSSYHDEDVLQEARMTSSSYHSPSSDLVGDKPGEMGSSLRRVDLGTGTFVVSMCVGDFHACAVLDDGCVKCWGAGWYGQLGYGGRTGPSANKGDTPGEMGDKLTAVNLGTGVAALSVTCGDAHTCALLNTSQIKCWGEGSSGQLGHGSTADKGLASGTMGDALPTVNLGKNVSAIAVTAGTLHTCATLSTFDVMCWGNTGVGATSSLTPSAMNFGYSPLVAVSIRAGNRYTCILLAWGEVKCVGTSAQGKLGDAAAVKSLSVKAIGDGTTSTVCQDGATSAAGRACFRITPGPFEGMLEVFANGRWGGVNANGFSTSMATAVCRQLGYVLLESGVIIVNSGIQNVVEY